MTETKPVVIPASYTIETPEEGFGSEDHGVVSWHTLLSNPKTPSSDMCCGLGVLPPSEGYLCAHRHTQAEIYYITQGEGVVTIDGVSYNVSKGATVFIPGNAEHGIKNSSNIELKWFYVFPTGDFSDIVYKFS